MLLTLANTITADMGLIPGLAFVGPAMGLPLSVLASVVERPFYSRGEVGSRAIWYSLQANLVSLIAGFVLLLVFGCLTSAVGLGASDAAFFVAWPVLAVCLSSIIERQYIARRIHSKAMSWGWTAAGNVVSAAVCVGVLFLVLRLREADPALATALRPYSASLNLVAGIGSLATFVVSFVATRQSVTRKVTAAA